MSLKMLEISKIWSFWLVNFVVCGMKKWGTKLHNCFSCTGKLIRCVQIVLLAKVLQKFKSFEKVRYTKKKRTQKQQSFCFRSLVISTKVKKYVCTLLKFKKWKRTSSGKCCKKKRKVSWEVYLFFCLINLGKRKVNQKKLKRLST